MSKTQTIEISQYNVAKGTSYLATQQIMIYLASFIYYLLLFRVLNLSEIGQVSLLLLAYSFFTTITQVTLPTASTRFISTNLGRGDQLTASRVSTTALRLLLTISGAGLGIGLLFSPWLSNFIFNTGSMLGIVATTFVAGFLLDLTTLYGSYFLGVGQYAKVLQQNLVYQPLSRTVSLLLAFTGLGVEGIALGWVLAGVITLLVSLYMWKGQLPRQSSSNASSFPVRTLLSFSLPVFASAILILFQNWGDIALLQTLLGQFSITGAYYLAVSSVAFLTVLWVPLTNSLYPAISSDYSRHGIEHVSERLGSASRLVNIIVLPASLGLAAMSPTALQVAYGRSLLDQSIPFAILTLASIFLAQTAVLVIALQAIGRTRPLLSIYSIATILDLAIVYVLAGSLGTTAGALGRMVLAISLFSTAYFFLRDSLDLHVERGLVKACLVGMCTGLLVFGVDRYLTQIMPIHAVYRLGIDLTVGLNTYLLSCRLFHVFEESDVQLLTGAMPLFSHRYLRRLSKILV